jgi:hypothetical protein
MKFLVFLTIVVAIWYVMRSIQRANAIRRTQRAADRSPFPATENPYAPGRRRTAPRATDMTPCPRCGAYIPADFPTACAREDCPFPKAG